MPEHVTINFNEGCSALKSGDKPAAISTRHSHDTAGRPHSSAGAASTASLTGTSGVTLILQGLCAIVDRGTDAFEIFLHPGDHHTGHAHQAMLTARIKDITLGTADLWEPTTLGVDGGGDQIGLWPIDADSRLTMGNGAKSWLARTRAIDLRIFHPAATTKSTDDIVKSVKGISILTLTGGEMRCQKEGIVNPMIDAKSFEGLYMTSAAWHTDTDLTLVHSNGKVIEFKDGSTVGISNVAIVDSAAGRDHFKHYYDLIDGLTGKPVTLGKVTGDEDVYDCVPPVPTPGA